MNSLAMKMEIALVLAIGAILAASPVLAEKPTWAGADKIDKHERAGQDGERRGADAESRRDTSAALPRGRFAERQRETVREYYSGQFRSGRCPPGLAKKRNGCMPPGQAKKWKLGRPLPREVIYFDLPERLTVQIGMPPQGYRYVRVATDILLIAIGTGMVIDAIEDLGRL